jgi:hypothetical protein
MTRPSAVSPCLRTQGYPNDVHFDLDASNSPYLHAAAQHLVFTPQFNKTGDAIMERHTTDAYCAAKVTFAFERTFKYVFSRPTTFVVT